jgi:hypothetical protein
VKGIRYWHPAKVAMLWVLDIALLIALWKPCDTDHLLGFSMTECFYARNILLWLVLSSPVFVLTWKWASARENHQSSDSLLKKAESIPQLRQAFGFAVGSLPRPLASFLSSIGFLVLMLSVYALMFLGAYFLIYLPSEKLTPYLLDWVNEENAGGVSILIVCAIGIGILSLVEEIGDRLSNRRYRKKHRAQE